MKTTTREVKEVTFHVTIKELIHNFLVSFSDIVNDTPYEDLPPVLGTVDVISDLRSENPASIRKVFESGVSVILIPDISNVSDDTYIKVHVTLSNGNVVYIDHECINY